MISLQYLAGFIDGEGCLQFPAAKGGGGMSLRISNTYLPILKEIQKEFGGSVRKFRERTETKRSTFYWNISGKKCKELLHKVLIYLNEKREQAEILLILPHIKPQNRKMMVDRLKRLKHIDYGEQLETTL